MLGCVLGCMLGGVLGRRPWRCLAVATLVAAAALAALAGAAAADPFAWTGNGGDTKWETAANWDKDPPELPGPEDDVFIGKDVEVSVTTGQAVQSLSLGNGGLLVNGPNAHLTLGSGESSIQRLVKVLDGAGVTLQGATEISSLGAFFIQPSAAVTNDLGGHVFLSSSSPWGGFGTFVNNGTFTHQSGAPVLSMTLVNNQALEVLDGQLKVGGLDSSGFITMAGGASLVLFQGASTIAGGVVSGAGTLQLEAGVFGAPVATVDSDVSFGVGGLHFDGGTLNLNPPTATAGRMAGSGGVLNLPGTLTVGPDPAPGGSALNQHRFNGAGKVRFAAGDPVGITGTTQATGGATLELAGNTTLSDGGNLHTAAPSVIHNLSEGTITSEITAGDWSGTGTIRNSGDIVHVDGQRAHTINLQNQGEITIEGGRMTIRGALLPDSDGGWVVEELGELEFGAGSFPLAAGGSVTGEGTMSLTSDVAGEPTVTFPDGAGLTVASVVVPIGILILDGTRTLPALTQYGGTVAGGGTTTVNSFIWGGGSQSGSGTTVIPSGASLVLGGVKKLFRRLRLERDTSWTVAGGDLHVHADGVLETAARLTLPDAADITDLGGIVRVAGVGTLVKTGDGTQSNVPSIQDGGTVTVAQGSRLVSPAVDISLLGVLRGAGTLAAPVINTGLVAPGDSPGVLTIEGPFTQSSEGALGIELEGMDSGSGFDRLVVTGHSALDGRLSLGPAASFSPPLDSTFQILASESRSGAFTSITGAQLPDARKLAIEYPGGPDFGARLRVGEGFANPPLPLITGTDPESPSNLNQIVVNGTAQAESTVRIYNTPGCTGAPLAAGSAEDFASTGLAATVPEDTVTHLRATATDIYGTSGCSLPVSFVEDSTPPARPEITGTDPDSPSADTTPQVRGLAEGGSTVRLFATEDCTGKPLASGPASLFDLVGIAVEVPTDSVTSLRATASDTVGNTSPCSQAFEYRHDAVPPDTTITDGPRGEINAATARFGFSSSETPATFECRVDGEAFAACTPPHATAALADGSHMFEVRATDAAGNTDPTPATRSFLVDTTGPQTQITSPGDGDHLHPNLAIRLASPEPAGFECRLDIEEFAPCPAVFERTVSTGAHTFAARAVTANGAKDDTPASISFEIVRGGALAEVRCFSDRPAPADGCAGISRGMLRPRSVAVSPDGRNLYVGSDPGGIAVFDRDGDGLTQKRGPAGCVWPTILAVAPDCATTDVLERTRSLALSPDGRVLYAGVRRGVVVLSRGSDGSILRRSGSRGCVTHPGAGALTGCATSRVLGEDDTAVALSPDGRNLYAGGAHGIAVFDVDGKGGLTQKAGSAGCVTRAGLVAGASSCRAASALSATDALAVSPDGESVYTLSSSTGRLVAFDRTERGNLRQKSGAAACVAGAPPCTVSGALSGAAALAVSPDGDNVYVASRGSRSVAVLDRDSTGRLRPKSGTAGCFASPAPDLPPGCASHFGLVGADGVAVSPDGRNVYVSSEFGDAVIVFDRRLTGVLAPKRRRVACVADDNPINDFACMGAHGLDGALAVTVSGDGKNAYAISDVGDAAQHPALSVLNRADDAELPLGMIDFDAGRLVSLENPASVIRVPAVEIVCLPLTVACRVSVTATTGAAAGASTARTRRVGSARLRVPAGRLTAARLKLNRQGRRLIVRRKRLRLALQVAVRQGEREVRRGTRVTLRVRRR